MSDEPMHLYTRGLGPLCAMDPEKKALVQLAIDVGKLAYKISALRMDPAVGETFTMQFFDEADEIARRWIDP